MTFTPKSVVSDLGLGSGKKCRGAGFKGYCTVTRVKGFGVKLSNCGLCVEIFRHTE